MYSKFRSTCCTATLALATLLGCGGTTKDSPSIQTNLASQKPVAINAINGYKSIGYWRNWGSETTSPKPALSTIQWSKITHVNYAFFEAVGTDAADPTTQDATGVTGSMVALTSAQSTELTNLVTAAHAAGSKVFISIFGGSNSNIATVLIRNASTRATAISQIVSLVNTYGLDGVDVDYEKAVAWNASTSATQAFITELHTALPSTKEISLAVNWMDKTGWTNTAVNTCDWVNFMAYDDWQGDRQHSPYTWAQWTLESALGSGTYTHGDVTSTGWGLAASKVVLGVPFYGWQGYTAGDHSWYTEYGFSYMVDPSLNSAARADTAPYDYSNVGAGTDGDGVATDGTWFNGIRTIQRKTKLAKDNGCAGIMYWQLNEDTSNTNSLVTAIYTQLNSTTALGENIATSGTGYTWKAMTSATANTTRTATTGINNEDLYTNNKCSTSETANRWEAAGVVWTTAQTVKCIGFLNGPVSSSKGYLQSGLSVQTSTDGTTWVDQTSGWTISSTYPYSSSAARNWYTITFTTAKTGLKGVRVSGKITTAGYYWGVREVQIYAN